jgi:hypothetical protein
MIKKLSIIITPLLLLSCGMSKQDKDEIATITCNIISESKNIDAVFRIQEVNKAREILGEERFLGKDTIIKEAFFYDLCKELVLNDPKFDSLLESKKEAYLIELKRVQDSILAEKQKDLDFLTKVYEEAVSKRELRVERYRKERSASQEEWRNNLIEYLSNYQPSPITVSYSNINKSLYLGFKCSEKIQGMKSRFVIRFNNGLKELVSDDSYCYSKGVLIDKKKLSKEHFNAIIEAKDDPKSIIKSISLELLTVVLIKNLGFDDLGQRYEEYFPQNYKHLEASEKLDNPIVYQLKF